MAATATRKPPKPVHGVCRWVDPLGPDDSSAVLAINGTEYTLHVNEDERTSVVLGYTLVKGDGSSYDIDAETWECSCPDCTFRGRQCKHSKAVQAAMVPQAA